MFAQNSIIVSLLILVFIGLAIRRSEAEWKDFCKYWDARDELYRWSMTHPGYRIENYPAARKIAERTLVASEKYRRWYPGDAVNAYEAWLRSLLQT